MVSESIFRIIFILAGLVVSLILIRALAKSLVDSISVGNVRGKRFQTLSSIVTSTLSILVVLIAAIMVLKEVGFDVTPIIASAGVVGLAVGFGAQTLVKDVIAGFFLLIENQFSDGDEVEVSGKKGVVKKVTLRTVWLEDKDGAVHIIPNGSITTVSNFSKSKG